MNWVLSHLIGDYILQSDWMALNKKKNSWACLIHVLTYMIPFLFCNIEAYQLYAIALQHFWQDRTNFVLWFMKIKGSENFSKGPCAPWSVILTDNILHVSWIYFILNIPIIFNF